MKSHIESSEMSSAIGSQIRLVFRSQFQTFTPDQFSKVLKEGKYLEARGQIPSPQGPQQPPIQIQTFSKEDVTIFLAPNNSIVFQILNTVNLETIYKKIHAILIALRIFPDIVSEAVFDCTTRTKAKIKPLERLTSLFDNSVLSGISKNLNHELKVCSIRLATAFPTLKREGGVQVVIEPLGSNPEKYFFLSIAYRTTKMNDFEKFIAGFGQDMIQRIIEEAEKDV